MSPTRGNCRRPKAASAASLVCAAAAAALLAAAVVSVTSVGSAAHLSAVSEATVASAGHTGLRRRRASVVLHDSVQWYGRTLVEGDARVFDFPGVSARFMVFGTTTIKMDVGGNFDTMWRVDLSGEFHNRLTIPNGRELITMAQGLDSTREYQVEITKISQCVVDGGFGARR